VSLREVPVAPNEMDLLMSNPNKPPAMGPAIMSLSGGDGWYAKNTKGRMERVLGWALLANGNITPIFAGDRIQPGSPAEYWHPEQYQDET
jgi:hypothetical protein